MSVEREIAFEVLGLPTFASEKEILHKYRQLALLWFPERYNNNQYAIEQFRQISEAASLLLNARTLSEEPMSLLDMYELFQNLFLKDSDSYPSTYEDDDDYDDYLSEESYNTVGGESLEEKKELAAETAQKLIVEEEQEKLKAQRKKAKKKRRKEKKKQEKLEDESRKQQNSEKKQKNSSQDQDETNKIFQAVVSDSEEALDPDSAFVAVVAKKQKRLQSLESKLEKTLNTIPTSQVRENPTSLLLRSRELALQANKLAGCEMFHEAIELFTESIKLDPSDHRFYGNRSYCYERLNQFDKALKDAEKSIALCPLWPKSYFRKGRALLGLRNYAQAEECFVKVLKLDNDCEDAIKELHNVKVLQIMELGYTKQQAEKALAQHVSVQESIESLISSQPVAIQPKELEEEVFVSDDESDLLEAQFLSMSLSSQKRDHLGTQPQKVISSSQSGIKPSNEDHVSVQKQSVAPSSQFYDIKMDPNNPENHNSLWVGNIQPDVTEKEISTMFGNYGELLSVKVMRDKFCAFINFKNKRAPGRAMRALQGFSLHGYNIVIRFPNLPGELPAKKKPGAVAEAPKPKQAEECYYWRTTGCTYGENCRNLHVKEHKGVDRKAWHKTCSSETKVEPYEKVTVKPAPAPVKLEPGKSVAKTKLFVGNLPDGCTNNDLKSLFSKYGKVTECDVVDRHGFVHMATADQAFQALENLDGCCLKGSYISVVPSTSKLHPAPGAPGRATKQTIIKPSYRR